MSRSTGEFEVVGSTIVPVIVNDVVPGAEASECADLYLDTLVMERCEGEEHTLELLPMSVAAPTVGVISLDELVDLMTRNWDALSELTHKQVLDAMINMYANIDSIVVEGAVDTALYLIRDEGKA